MQNEDRDLLPIGSLIPKIAPLPSNLAFSQMASGPNTETSGLRFPAVGGSSSIGGRHGGITAAGLPSGLRTTLQGADAWRSDKALLASLPPQIARLLASRVSEDFDVIGYDLKPGCAPAEIRAALAIVEAACEPAPVKIVIQELARLNSVTQSREREGTDLEAHYVGMAEGLSEFPADVIRDGCRSYAKCHKWRPTLAELRDFCWHRYRARHSLRETLRRAA